LARRLSRQPSLFDPFDLTSSRLARYTTEHRAARKRDMASAGEAAAADAGGHAYAQEHRALLVDQTALHLERACGYAFVGA